MRKVARYGAWLGERFKTYTSVLMREVGQADRAKPLRLYCAGPLVPGERKSVEPMVAGLTPGRVRSTHQRTHHLVADSPWRDRRVLVAVREYALPVFEAHGGVAARIVDDTEIPKKGCAIAHSPLGRRARGNPYR